MARDLKQLIKNIPNSPGCYKYFDNKGELIYIGKAKNLKKRVSSYFVGVNDPKTTVLVENIHDIRWEVTDSEIEALILESNLIKKHKPRFNIKIKDDKDFLWVKIDLNEKYPQPYLVRRSDVGATGSVVQKEGRTSGSPLRGTKFFGPFTDARLLREGLAILQKIFLWRDCSAAKFSLYGKKGRPCLEYQIKNCSAPCCGFVNDNDYRLGIKHLVRFLEGKKEKIIKDLRREMESLAKKKKFEEAGRVRDRLKGLEHIGASLSLNQESRIPPIRRAGTNQEVGTTSSSYLIKNIITVLNKELGYGLKFKKDFRIEFYDISNTSGTEAVGSMVVSVGGEMAKDQYRKFKVKYIKGPNDVGMMREVLSRRLKKLKVESEKLKVNESLRDDIYWPTPDLIVLDGGKPQLGEIARLFSELKIDIPLLGLAKEEEEVWGLKKIKNEKLKIKNHGASQGGRFIKLGIAKNSAEGFFLQRIRDEAHRFAIGYHKNLRSNKMIKSRLDEIEGIGPKTKKKLILKFGSVDGIIKANLDEVAEIVGKKMAAKVKETL